MMYSKKEVLFQKLMLISAFLMLGSVGALEGNSIGVGQFFAQMIIFSICTVCFGVKGRVFI